MKIAGKLLLSVILFGGGFAAGSMVLTSNADGIIDPNQPGSANDPLVTKSYVEEQVKALVQAELNNQSATDKGQVGSNMTVVELHTGDTLYAGEGTEFIVRTGRAIAVSTTDSIPDLTDGNFIEAGKVIPKNHLLLFPREDGRGIKPHPDNKEQIFVMVRGTYLQLDADGKQVDRVSK